MTGALCNVTTGAVVAARVRRVKSWKDRLLGFLGRSSIDREEGLWFDDCSAIHTLGMRTRIDVLFLDERGVVRRIAARVRAYRAVVSSPGASSVVELAPGTAERIDLLIGDRLTFVAPAA